MALVTDCLPPTGRGSDKTCRCVDGSGEEAMVIVTCPVDELEHQQLDVRVGLLVHATQQQQLDALLIMTYVHLNSSYRF